MINKYNCSILGYLVSCLLCCHAAMNTNMSRNDGGGIKNDSLLENDPELNYVPSGPLVMCSFLPMEFIECEDLVDLKGNKTRDDSMTGGCSKYGGSYRYEDVEKTTVQCMVLPGIECHGNRKFNKKGFPCVKYGGYYFLTTLLYSILLGFLGMDRFCLGQTGTAVGKLLTLGGGGVWWILDVILLVTNQLLPEDGSNWNIYV
ncbi:TM2 domain-containing protein CG11103 [Melanaphis sacchari]|uniref:TM2 domain-containing protein CG11103 n=1 Tax=Melanaphis sacchari TaxID=742174 RepID=A0A2H8TUX7_9HEMI|nr:TM2 domain-containing protein CG11103 [Melanaphis sacchari]